MNKEDSFHLGVKALIHNPEGKLLLLQAPKAKGAYWDVPGGRIHKNESLANALRREVYEETGIQDITGIKPFVITLSNIRIPFQNGDVGLIYAFHLCDVLLDTPIRLSAEHTHFAWFEPSKASQLLAETFPSELTKKLASQAKSFRSDGFA